jgi:hypothetical protein
MAWLLDIQLIHLFDVYLVLIFLVSLVRRVRQYRTIIALVSSFPGRWPKVLQLVHKHLSIFVTWSTIRPLALLLGLMIAQGLANVLFINYSRLTFQDLPKAGIAAPLLGVLGLAMVLFDAFGAWRVGVVDRAAVEKNLDQAEYWLESWAAPVVRVFTFGWVNPRRLVSEEVRKALVKASQSAGGALRWLSIQTGLRFAFGLTLWITSALVAPPEKSVALSGNSDGHAHVWWVQ